MKNLFFLIVLMSLRIICSAQAVSFKLFGKSNCSDKISVVSLYTLSSDSLFVPIDTTGVCILPDTGYYRLKIDNNLRTYHFTKKILYQDTITTMSLELRVQNSHLGISRYFYCDSVADGIVESYFSNGRTQASGVFKQGIPVGVIKFFFSNGKIQNIIKYNKIGKYQWAKTYNENGRRLRFEKKYKLKPDH